VFTARSVSRELSESDEGTLHWVPRVEIAALDLVEDLAELIPRAVALADDAPPLFVHVSYDDSDAIQMRFADA
jgi:hypothetical protein